MPLHTLLTDVVEMCGGSSVLVHILNRLGAVSSTDTHHRYVQYTVTKQLQEDKIPNLAPHAFTIASADNLDCSQPHATVYSGDQSRSWHGTTMQVVQPKPQSLQNLQHIPTSDHDYIVTRCRFASGYKRQLSDPDGDPSLKKKCRRARTLTEGPHPTSELLLSSRASIPVQRTGSVYGIVWRYFYADVAVRRAVILGSVAANVLKRNVDQAVDALTVTTDHLKLQVSLVTVRSLIPV